MVWNTHNSSISLVVGGIYLAALNLSYNDKGLWLLLDNEISISYGDQRPVKSTYESTTPLTWFHLWPLDGLENITQSEKIWNSYSDASLKIFNSPKISASRDEMHSKRGKLLLSGLLYETEGIVSTPFPDEVNEEIYTTERFREGSVRKVTVNAYERNSEARNRCISYYGCRCCICEFDFEKTYGEFGRGVIHVHHLKPISEIGEKYEIVPIEDMRPVCPNCHTIIHRRNPPYIIEEVKSMLKKGEV